jgi:hypothetical protein
LDSAYKEHLATDADLAKLEEKHIAAALADVRAEEREECAMFLLEKAKGFEDEAADLLQTAALLLRARGEAK